MEGYLVSLAGGALLGVSGIVLLLLQGRIAGISGIMGGLLPPATGDTLWRALFVAGLILGGAVSMMVSPELFAIDIERSHLAIAAAGLLVGFGTRLGSGCTSGHGICGVSRMSPRSIVATITFIAAGAIAVAIINRLLGGSL